MTKTLTERDHALIWHPYTQHKNKIPPIPIVRGKNSLLFDDKGNAYIDAISSWWVNIHGHAHPHIAQKIFEQASQLEHVIFTGFTHEPAVRLAERLLPILPGEFSRIFYSDNGSTAVEVAIKMAIQFWKNQEPTTERRTVMAFHHSYHGDTFGAMSISERSVFTDAFQDYLFDVEMIDTPDADNIDGLLANIREWGSRIACFIYEPLIQGAGGMRMYEAALLDRLIAACQQQGIICIADEVMTGFGRTGKRFAGEYMDNKADIICLSKGLTGGAMALGVTAATERIFNAFLDEDRTKTLFHGHSFTANPIACAAALASMDLFTDPACMENIERISALHQSFIERLNAIPHIRGIRAQGTIIAFEVNAERDGYINSVTNNLSSRSLEAGIYLRPLGNTIYIMPPYCTTGGEMHRIYDFILRWLQKI